MLARIPSPFLAFSERTGGRRRKEISVSERPSLLLKMDFRPDETDHMFANRRSAYACCSCFPRFSSSLWKRGRAALMKVREWSERIAGPRWKTFLRRFNSMGGNPRGTRFHYDPLSYALNFDEGPNEDDDDEVSLRRGLSARFVAPTTAAKPESAKPAL